ncbi:carboxy terminal-processing peptidase [Pleionea litopenaei]|uniref:Carboxy terminal-processing peptidase n=1 Tax=Pleionea litopenaei TaxID=3070815 RepID=A0AA51RVK4_9GAMM|nr:carboxy terminal-processing peptidase [Pleionea sp. HL-JVS1]WMS88309.1 carboxy terminal-processing peptidase [Pleionea sp. HL-JVS1]
MMFQAKKSYSLMKSVIVGLGVAVPLALFGQGVLENKAATKDNRDKALLNTPTSVESLMPLPSHSSVSRMIALLIAREHYLKTNLESNDALSEQILGKYIELLDGNKSYFYADDVQSFQRYRKLIDDSIISGQLKPAFDMYQVFQTRTLERYNYAIELLEKPFDFQKQESYHFDREDRGWATSLQELNELWRKRVKAEALSLMLADKSWEETKEILVKRYKMAQRRIEQNKSEDVFEYFMNAFALTVEPHSSYFSPREAENFDIEMKLSLEGIGAILQMDDVYTKVNKLVTGAPAEKSKQIQEGDRIVGVGQGKEPIEDVVGWRLDDVVDLIRGEAGSKVRLQILPKGEVGGETKVVTLTREQVKLEELSAKSETIKVDMNNQQLTFGVIEIPKFYVDWDAKNRLRLDDYKSTTRDVEKFLKAFEKENIDGLIIDLRNNGGGALDEAVELTGLFIDQGPVVQQRDSRNQVTSFDDNQPGIVYNGPLAVLVNGGSASASEIFAGAIQDYGRGIVIGEQTFGKGTVQSMIDLNYYRSLRDSQLGHLKLTTSKFYRVSGETTQHRGVVPDIQFPSAFSPEEFGESSYENALAWDTISKAKFKPENRFEGVIGALNERHLQRRATSKEFSYLQKDIEEYLARKDDKDISLSLTERRKEIDEQKAKRLKRINQRLVDKGLKPVESLKDFDEKIFEEDDFRLQESGNILADYIVLKNRKKLAEKH